MTKITSKSRHPADAFPVEQEALVDAILRTAWLMEQGDACPAEQMVQASAELAFAQRVLAEKVAQVRLPASKEQG
jgi:hypothetical protein